MAQQPYKETRQVILDAAYKAFGKHGFDGTSIKTIAREAGLAPGSIYNHFADKEELFELAVKNGWEEFLTEFHKIGESSLSLSRKFEGIIDTGFDLLKKARPLLKGMFFGANQRKLVQEYLDQFMDAWEKIILNQQKQDLNSLILTRQQRKTFIRYTVMGVILAVAMAEDVDNELEKIKSDITILVNREMPASGIEID